MTQEEFLGKVKTNLDLCNRDFDSSSQWGRYWEVLELIRNETAMMNAEYIMVIHPFQAQVDAQLRRAVMERFDLSPLDYEVSKPQRFVADFCSERGIRCLDLIPSLAKDSEKEILYLHQDTHYNSMGNELAANQLKDSLLQEVPSLNGQSDGLSGARSSVQK